LDKPGIEATHYENIFLKVTDTRGVKPGIPVDIATVAVAQALNYRLPPYSGRIQADSISLLMEAERPAM